MAKKKQAKRKSKAKAAKPAAKSETKPVVQVEDIPPAEPERKDHVLQTRVPKNLYDELVDKAHRLRVPVSNLVRNILEDSVRVVETSVRMVENIVDNSLDIAESFSDKARQKDLKQVLGWQPLIANRKLVCSNCHASIPKGDDCFVSIGAPGDRNFILCTQCKSEM